MMTALFGREYSRRELLGPGRGYVPAGGDAEGGAGGDLRNERFS